MTAIDGDRPPLFQPPKLRTRETRAASRLELFFDLAYVLCVAQIASSFLTDLDRDGVLEFIGLFAVVWLSWVQFTLHNNRFDTDDLILRFAKLAAMLAILGAAASMSDALGDKVVPFTCSYALGRVILAALYFRAWKHVPDARGTTTVYLVSMTGVAALWVVSIAVPVPWNFAVWGLASLIDLAAPIVAGRRRGRAPLHLEHLPDRFGLLVILVLGEVIAGIVTGVHDTKWAAVSVVIGVAGFLVAAALWWAYFDVGGTVSAHAIQVADEQDQKGSAAKDETASADPGAEPDTHDEPVDERHDLFVYGHWPLTAGILAVAVGVEELVLHPDRSLPSSASYLVSVGVAAFLLGAGMLLRGGEQRSRLSLVWPLAAALAMLAWGVVGLRDPLVFAAGAAVLTIAAAFAGAVISRLAPKRSTDEGGLTSDE